MATQQKVFHFLELPPELREYVYEHAFEGEVIVHGSKHAKVRTPGILLVCREIHLEAVHIFYKTAAFSFLESSYGLEWYLQLPGIYRNTIKHMRLRCQTSLNSKGPGNVAGLYALERAESFWKVVKRHDLTPRPSILSVKAVVWTNNAMPRDGLQLWDGEVPTRAKLPTARNTCKTVWVSPDTRKLRFGFLRST